jgi:transposase-like protein
MPKQRIPFDHKKFARDYLSGQYDVASLAEKHGISESLAYKVITGERRPEVAEAIRRAREADTDQFRIVLDHLRCNAIDMLRRALGGGVTGAGIAAAKEILRRAMPAEPPEPLRRRPAQLPAEHVNLLDLLVNVLTELAERHPELGKRIESACFAEPRPRLALDRRPDLTRALPAQDHEDEQHQPPEACPEP